MTRFTKSKTRRALTTGLLGLALLGLIPLAAHAFGRGGKHQPDPDRALARLTEQLDLTAEQQVQARAILEEGFAKGAALQEARRQELEARKNQAHENLAAVLTPEQAAKLDQLRAERRERRQCRQDCDRRPGR